jgi:hypothetical protein
MNPAVFLGNLPPSQRWALEDLNNALGQLDRAYARLSDDTFERLPPSCQRLSNAMLAVLREWSATS